VRGVYNRQSLYVKSIKDNSSLSNAWTLISKTSNDSLFDAESFDVFTFLITFFLREEMRFFFIWRAPQSATEAVPYRGGKIPFFPFFPPRPFLIATFLGENRNKKLADPSSTAEILKISAGDFLSGGNFRFFRRGTLARFYSSIWLNQGYLAFCLGSRHIRD